MTDEERLDRLDIVGALNCASLVLAALAERVIPDNDDPDIVKGLEVMNASIGSLISRMERSANAQ